MPKALVPGRRAILKALGALPVLRLFGALQIGPVAAQPMPTRVVTSMLVNEPAGLLSLVDTSAIAFTARATEGLLTFDYDLTPKPLLATDWDIAPDGLTYHFKLRQGVTWHDGEPFTAKDVKFSIETQKRFHSRGRITFSNIDTIEAPDDHTVILHLRKPTPYLLLALSSAESPVVPSHRYGAADPLTHPNNQAPVGTGAWIFREWVRGSHVLWERNEKYWNPAEPRADRLVARFILDPEACAIALETGVVDIGYRTPVPYRDVERLRDVSGISFEERGYTYDPPNIILIECNLRDEILNHIKVRQAIAHCIDREAICRIIFFGNALPSAAPVVPYHREFHNSMPSPYPFDVAAAERLLEEAGYPRTGREPRLTLTMDFFGDEQRLLAEFIRSALGRAGIRVRIRGQDVGTLVKRVYGERQFQLHLCQISNLFDPQVGVQRLYWSKNIIPGVAFSNGTSYSNPKVDELLEAAAVSLDHADRVEKWMKIQEIVMNEVPNIAIAMPKWMTIARSPLKDHTTGAEGFEGSFSKAYIET